MQRHADGGVDSALVVTGEVSEHGPHLFVVWVELAQRGDGLLDANRVFVRHHAQVDESSPFPELGDHAVFAFSSSFAGGGR